ncbi:NAD dependent epimerase/dehydratase [Mycena epipterygia]|nr:NAD dependent epimerase/dehydratase [Mycena epipterygia]
MSRGVVLVTGINGYLGTYTALAFLDAGAQDWIVHFPKHKASYEYAVVEDLAAPGAFDEVVKGCDIIAHVASPNNSPEKQDNEVDMLIPAINGTKNLLYATKNEPRIRSVVFTSTLGAVIQSGQFQPGKVYTEKDWNPATHEEAKVSTNPRFVYGASKTLAERAFWDYIKDEQPAWAGTTICPSGIFDPPIQPLTSLAALNLSVAFLWNVASGKYKAGLALPASRARYVSARDCALAQVRAVERDAARNQRYLLVARSFEAHELVEIIGRNFPTMRDNLPAPQEQQSHEFSFDASKTTKDLGFEWMSFEQTVVDTIASVIALDEKFKAST